MRMAPPVCLWSLMSVLVSELRSECVSPSPVRPHRPSVLITSPSFVFLPSRESTEKENRGCILVTGLEGITDTQSLSS